LNTKIKLIDHGSKCYLIMQEQADYIHQWVVAVCVYLIIPAFVVQSKKAGNARLFIYLFKTGYY